MVSIDITFCHVYNCPNKSISVQSLITFIADLRLELLEVPCDQDLVRALYGLLMLLPQTDAFHTLRARLACIPSLHLECVHKKSVYMPLLKHVK